MKIKESDNEIYGTYISGIVYTIIVAIILILFCFAIDEEWFDHTITFIIIAVICIIFYISGLKKVQEKNLGFLLKFGKRHFDEYYSEGWWWIFPLWSFKQKPHFDIFNKGEEISVKYITSDEIPIDVQVQYYWQLKNPEDLDNKYSPSYIKDKLIHELGIFVRNRNATVLLSDVDISKKVLSNYLISTGEKIGILISDVFPNINYESKYLNVVSKYQEKYKDLQFQFDELLKHQKIKELDMKIYENQIVNCINNLGFTPIEAMNLIKVYKNKVNMNENTYNIELNKVLESVITYLKNNK